MKIPEFSSLVEHTTLDDEKVKLDTILGKRIIICGYKISPSKFKDKGCDFFLKVQFYFYDDEERSRKIFFSGSNVIKDQLNEVKSNLEHQGLPFKFKCMVKKVGNYYSLV